MLLAPQGVGIFKTGYCDRRGCEPVRVVCFNVNGLKDERKRKMVVASCMKGRVDVLGVSETHESPVGKRM